MMRSRFAARYRTLMVRSPPRRASRTMQAKVSRGRDLVAPLREGVVEGALAGGALLDGDDRAGLGGIDQGEVEPGAVIQQLDVAAAVGVGVGEADQEEAVGDLDRGACERRAARLLVRL